MKNLQYLFETSSQPIQFFDEKIIKRHKNLLDSYYLNCEDLIRADSAPSWFESDRTKFFGPSRILGRVLYNYFDMLDRDVKILDFGCGDGLFVKLLKSIGFLNVNGIDNNPLNNFHKFLNIENHINQKIKKCDIFIALNVAQGIPYKEFITLAKSYSPSLIIFDREYSRKCHSEQYYNNPDFFNIWHRKCFQGTGLKTELLIKL